MMPMVSLWAKQKAKINRRVIVDVLEDQISSSMLYKVIFKWKSSILHIQHTMKACLMYKLTLYESLCAKWNLAEVTALSRYTEKKNRRRQTGVFRTNISGSSDSMSTIPIEIKLFYIRNKIKEILKIYHSSFIKYKAEIQSIHTKNVQNQWSFDYTALPYPLPPVKPLVSDVFTVEILTEIITSALKNRASWPALMASREHRSSRNKHYSYNK